MDKQKDLRHYLNMKKIAFLQNDQQKAKELNKAVKHKIKDAQRGYKENVEEKSKTGNIREVWKGLNTIMGRKKERIQQCEDSYGLANDLNIFYSRFDNNLNEFTVSNAAMTEIQSHTMTIQE